MIELLAVGIWGLFCPILVACAILAPFLFLLEYIQKRERKKGKSMSDVLRSNQDSNKIW
jgi:hypothetical protein